MIFAVIGSIDGNDHALNVALDAIAEAGIHTILHTGNAVVGAPGGNEVMALLAAHRVTCVQGITDRMAVRFSRKQDTMERKVDGALLSALRFAHEHLTSENLETLRNWRKSKAVALEDLSGFLCHGSPGNPREILTADAPLEKLKRQRETARADIIICGGAEAPFSRMVDGTLFVSPGTLCPNGDTARYLLVNTEQEPWSAAPHIVAL